MKKNLLLKSGTRLLIVAGVSLLPFAAVAADISIYESLQMSHQSEMGAVRGAQGPIRSAVDVQQPANDIYTSLQNYQSGQSFQLSAAERGAQGPIRSEADMAMERNTQQWKQWVGPFYGSD